MTKIHKSLEKLGFSKNEVTVYSYLLKKGSSLGSDIYQETGLDKSSAYRALNRLSKMGVIYSAGQTRNQSYTAFPVDTLFKLYEDKKKEFNRIEGELKEFVDGIDDYVKENYKNTNVKVYEGSKGFKAFMNDRLDEGSREILQLGPLQKRIAPLEDFYAFADTFIEERVKREIGIKVLFDSTVETDHLDRMNPQILKEARQLGKALNLDASIAIYGNKVGLYSRMSGTFIGIVIEDKLIAHLMRAMFMYMWNDAKEVY